MTVTFSLEDIIEIEESTVFELELAIDNFHSSTTGEEAENAVRKMRRSLSVLDALIVAGRPQPEYDAIYDAHVIIRSLDECKEDEDD